MMLPSPLWDSFAIDTLLSVAMSTLRGAIKFSFHVKIVQDFELARAALQEFLMPTKFLCAIFDFFLTWFY